MKSIPPLLLATSCWLFTLFPACRNQDTPASSPTPADTAKGDDEIVMSILYQQKAAEYRALCLQSYGLARQRVAEAIAKYKKGKDTTRLAVVTDLDETALDNSSNEAWLYLHDSSYSPAQFNDWTLMSKAGAVPGALSFFNYVDQQKDRHGRNLIDIYYVSNRKDTLPVITATKKNMDSLGFPQTQQQHFLFDPSKDPSKESRRQNIQRDHKIILLLGDNLPDFDAAFDNIMTNPDERTKRVDSLAGKFGDRYIIFPNAEYGDWEGALYKGKYGKLSEERKMRKEALHSW